MRSYSVVVSSLAVHASPKWTDNLLSHHEIPEVAYRKRGVARGISWQALVRIYLIRLLHQRLGCGVREAVALAAELIDSPVSALTNADPITLAFDRSALERTLRQRLLDALESAPGPRRGRPKSRALREAGR
jgi:hypothetical protein